MTVSVKGSRKTFDRRPRAYAFAAYGGKINIRHKLNINICCTGIYAVAESHKFFHSGNFLHAFHSYNDARFCVALCVIACNENNFVVFGKPCGQSFAKQCACGNAFRLVIACYGIVAVCKKLGEAYVAELRFLGTESLSGIFDCTIEVKAQPFVTIG